MPKKVTRVKPAPLKYPNGGGIRQSMSGTKGVSPAVIKASREALEAKHAAERVKFEDKHGSQEWSK
jgi:hypothetical protein